MAKSWFSKDLDILRPPGETEGAAWRDTGAARRDKGAAWKDRGAARRNRGAARRDRGAVLDATITLQQKEH